MVKLLIDNGATVDVKYDLWKQTPLHFAAEEGHMNVVKLLIDHIADVNMKDKFGDTPIHRAALSGERFIPFVRKNLNIFKSYNEIFS